uniref:Uncharacterized protein n=1 Tax=Romanomermis culicivorax TaxID=13658 RepID=A0A915JRD4_ROMCU
MSLEEREVAKSQHLKIFDEGVHTRKKYESYLDKPYRFIWYPPAQKFGWLPNRGCQAKQGKIKRSLTLADTTYIGTTNDTIHELIEQYVYGGDRQEHFGNIEQNEYLAMATILDPRFKGTKFSNKIYMQEATEAIMQKLKTLIRKTKTVDDQIADASKPKRQKQAQKSSAFWTSDDEMVDADDFNMHHHEEGEILDAEWQ